KTSDNARSRRIHGVLVAAEIALALVPLVGASLLLRSLQRMLDVSPGFQTQHVLAMEVPHAVMTLADFSKLSNDDQNKLAEKQSLEFETLMEQIRALPGVQAAGGVTVLPLSNGLKSASRFVVEGQPIPESSGRPVAQTRTVSLGYFSAAGIPLVK